MRWVAGLTLLVLGAGACGSKANTASQLHMCAPDGAAWVSVPVSDAGPGPAPPELTCPGSLSDYCLNYAPGCPAANFADVVAEQNTTGYPGIFYLCDPYNWVAVGWACNGNSVLFAYDKTTGKLLGAVQLAAPGDGREQICLAGPSTLSPVAGCTAYFDCIPIDGGPPEGRCYGDGGVDASGP